MKKRSICLGIVLILCMTGCGNAGKDANPTPVMTGEDIFQSEKNLTTEKADASDVLAEELEQTEVEGLEYYNAANRIRRTDIDKDQNSLFCIDPETGVVYFVNQNQDNYIYRLKDGEAELAVPMPARDLYLWDGTLYFMVDDYDSYRLKDMKEGDIYAYTPADGALAYVYSIGDVMGEFAADVEITNQQKMVADETGIHFVGNIDTVMGTRDGKVYQRKLINRYFLPFGTGEVQKVEEDRIGTGWGEYKFSITVFTDEDAMQWLTLRPRQESGVKVADYIRVLPISHMFWYFVMEDTLYTLHDAGLFITNLTTMEQKVYNSSAWQKELLEIQYEIDRIERNIAPFSTFTVTENDFWVLDKRNYLIRFNRETEKVIYYHLSGEKTASIDTLYTDGRTIYAVTSRGVARLMTEEADMNANDEKIRNLKSELLVGK